VTEACSAVSIGAIIISIGAIIVSIAGIIVSYIVARKYGDLAAVEATRRFHEEDARRVRMTALQSLVNEVERIQKVVEHNRQLTTDTAIQPVARMPVAAFETAFVSGRTGLNVSKELLQVATDYLACADGINSLVESYPASLAGLGTRRVPNYSDGIIEQIAKVSEHRLPEILERLRTHLQEEISGAKE